MNKYSKLIKRKDKVFQAYLDTGCNRKSSAWVEYQSILNTLWEMAE